MLALHQLIAEEMLLDALALDRYRDELREDILRLRQRTGNRKLGENLEVAAERTREYRRRVPGKVRGRQERPPDRWGGGGVGTRPPPPAPVRRG